jgi:hypothetical protein
MDPRSTIRKIIWPLLAVFWIAACEGSSGQPPASTDAAADSAQDATSYDAAMQDVRLDRGGVGIDSSMMAGDVCTPLAVPCDGPEDCPTGQLCCGSLGMGAGGIAYTNIACQPSCAPADAGAASDAAPPGGLALVLELCHAGGTCHDNPMYMCSSSTYLPSFLYRCYTMGAAAPATATGGPGVNCGSTTCGAGQECCVRGPTDMSPYCAPVGQACSCAGPSSDGGSTTDAGNAGDASDTGHVEAASDAPPEASGDAADDVMGSDAHE